MISRKYKLGKKFTDFNERGKERESYKQKQSFMLWIKKGNCHVTESSVARSLLASDKLVYKGDDTCLFPSLLKGDRAPLSIAPSSFHLLRRILHCCLPPWQGLQIFPQKVRVCVRVWSKATHWDMVSSPIFSMERNGYEKREIS